MITHGNTIRLTQREMQLIEELTDSDASHIKTRPQLQKFVDIHTSGYSEQSPEESLMLILLQSVITTDLES